MKKGIVLAEFGDRERQIKGLVKNVRSVSTLPVVIYTDRDYFDFGEGVTTRKVAPRWTGHRRYYNRNNDYWKIVAAREFELTLVLDDDMRIVNEQFIQGFDLAEKFGICLPINPRVYFGFDREVGDDVDDNIKRDTIGCPYYMTGNNMGVIFVNTCDHGVKHLLDVYLEFMEQHTCRGPVAMGVACWRSKCTPYFLPEEWCVCGGYNSFKERTRKQVRPMFLHVGHSDVNEWFGHEKLFERFRG